MNLTLIALENHTKLGPTRVAKLLGVAYATYAQYRSELRHLPRYHSQHARLLHILTAEQLAAHIDEVLNGNTSET